MTRWLAGPVERMVCRSAASNGMHAPSAAAVSAAAHRNGCIRPYCGGEGEVGAGDEG